MRLIFPLFCLLLLLAVPNFGQSLSFSSAPSVVAWRSQGYDPNSLTYYNVAFTFTIQNTYTTAKSYAISATLGDYSDQPGGAAYFIYPRASKLSGEESYLFYQLYKANTFTDNDILTDTDGGPQHLFGGSVQSNSTTQATLYMRIPPEQLVLSGLYLDTIQFKLYEGPFFIPQLLKLEDTANIPVQIETVSYLFFDLVSDNEIGKNTHINFGAITPNKTKTISFRFRSNANVTITFDSENNGKLKNATYPDFEIPYTMMINIFSPYDLTTDPPQVLNYSFLQDSTKAFRVDYKLPSVIPNVTAETYTDVINVTLENP